MGKAKALCRPQRAATAARGKFASASTSAIQTGSRLIHTWPGKPMPAANAVLRVNSVKSPRPGVPASHAPTDSLEDTRHGFVQRGRFRQHAGDGVQSRPALRGTDAGGDVTENGHAA